MSQRHVQAAVRSRNDPDYSESHARRGFQKVSAPQCLLTCITGKPRGHGESTHNRRLRAVSASPPPGWAAASDRADVGICRTGGQMSAAQPRSRTHLQCGGAANPSPKNAPCPRERPNCVQMQSGAVRPARRARRKGQKSQKQDSVPPGRGNQTASFDSGLAAASDYHFDIGARMAPLPRRRSQRRPEQEVRHARFHLGLAAPPQGPQP